MDMKKPAPNPGARVRLVRVLPKQVRPYTPARKDYIHKVLFSELISRKNTFQLQDFFSRMNFDKITYHVFVCESEKYMEKRFGNYFLGKSHFSYMK